MTLISYAQNFEDVLLWRALGDVGPGFYIDVGAQHPRVDSVSQLFHDHGWQGIHIEPSPAYAALLRAQRPGDAVIEAALSAERGTAVFHEFQGTGLSTLAQSALESASARGFSAEDRTVRTMTLDDVLASVDRPIHWLKIDVEGHERAVIDGWTGAVRPWVLVIESTLPGSRTEAYDGWEPEILAKGYRFVWFDGLNRFYVHADHAALAVHFGTPPNVFDAFALSGEATSAFANLMNERTETLEAALDERGRAAEARASAAEQHAAEQDATSQRLAAAAAMEQERLATNHDRLTIERDRATVERDQLAAALDTLQHAQAAERDAVRAERAGWLHERDRMLKDAAAARQQIDRLAAAGDAASQAHATAVREAAVAAAVAEQAGLATQARAAMERDAAARAAAERNVQIEQLRQEHHATRDALRQMAERGALELAAMQTRLEAADAAHRQADADAAAARQDAAVATALLAEIRLRMAAVITEAGRQRRADQDVLMRQRAAHADERQRADAAQAALDETVAGLRVAVAAAQQAEREALHRLAEQGHQQATALMAAKADTEARAGDVARLRGILDETGDRLVAAAGRAADAIGGDAAAPPAAGTAEQRIAAALHVIDRAIRHCSLQLPTRAGDMPLATDGTSSTGMTTAIGHSTETILMEHRVAEGGVLNGLKRFWAHDAVADRMDAAVAAMTAQVDVSLAAMRDEMRNEMQRVQERCDAIATGTQAIASSTQAIAASTSQVPTIAQAIPQLMQTADHLVDIGVVGLQQTARIGQTLAAGIVTATDRAESAAPGVPEPDVVMDTDRAAEAMAPPERQIYANFARAVRASVS